MPAVNSRRSTFRSAASLVIAVLGLCLGLGAPARAAAHTWPDRLFVTYDNGHGGIMRRVLLCHPSGGSYPDPGAACARLDELHGPVGPVPHGTVCSMLYGGPQRAWVDGRWRGVDVHENFSRRNGCEIDRWRLMEPVLPHQNAAGRHAAPAPDTAGQAEADPAEPAPGSRRAVRRPDPLPMPGVMEPSGVPGQAAAVPSAVPEHTATVHRPDDDRDHDQVHDSDWPFGD
nr:SSI family serine proteinase inhibitor [Streptomyces sp. SID5468]